MNAYLGFVDMDWEYICFLTLLEFKLRRLDWIGLDWIGLGMRSMTPQRLEHGMAFCVNYEHESMHLSVTHEQISIHCLDFPK